MTIDERVFHPSPYPLPQGERVGNEGFIINGLC